MNHRTAFVLLALGCAGPGTAWAADWHVAPPSRKYPGPPSQAALAWVAEHAHELGLSSVTLQVKAELGATPFRTVRLAPRHAGLIVFDSTVAVRIGPGGEIRAAVVDVPHGLAVAPAASLDEPAARAVIESKVGHALGPESKLELGILPHLQGGGNLAWRAEVLGKGGMERWTIDAHTGALLQVASLARSALGNVYDINAIHTPTVAERELKDLMPSTPQVLEGTAGRVYRHVSGDGQDPQQKVKVDGTVVAPDADGNFLFQPSATQPVWDDSFAEVNLYYHLTRVRDYFANTLKVDFAPADDPGKYSLMAVANYGPPAKTPFDNAFFTPYFLQDGSSVYRNAIFVGQGPSRDFAYDSDVVLHEYTHYVNSNTIGFNQGIVFDEYGVVSTPGALDEGSADYFSCTVNDEPIIGEASLGQYQRDLTGKGGMCPDTVSGESHHDGELFGTAAWAVRAQLGKDLADPLIWDALSLMTEHSSFQDWVQALTLAASDLKSQGKATDAQLQAIQSAMHARGLDVCARFIELTPGKLQKVVVGGFDTIATQMNTTCEQLRQWGAQATTFFHFKVATKATDERVRFHAKLSPMNSGTLDWDMYVRRDEPVLFEVNGLSLKIASFDTAVRNLTSKEADVVVDSDTTPPFQPGATYDMVIMQRNCPNSTGLISTTAEEPPPDAGPDALSDGPPQVEAGPDGMTVADAAREPDVQLEAMSEEAMPTAQPVPIEGGAMLGGGCGCREAGGRRHGAGVAALVVAGLAAAVGRRKNRLARARATCRRVV